MLSKTAKFLLVVTAVAPMFLTWAFADWRNRGPTRDQLLAIAVGVGFALVCALLMSAARRQLTIFAFSAVSLRHADSEVVGFLVAYLLPLVSMRTAEFDYYVLSFVAVLVAAVVWASEAYSFNPLLALLGFHFYEVESGEGVTYLLITRREPRRAAEVTNVAVLSRSVLLDMSDRG